MESEGRSIIHMEVGEPDFATPAPIVEAGQAALAGGRTKYTPARGLSELREKIAGHYLETYGLELSPERIMVTPGSSGALQLVLSALVNPGEKVLLADPGYPCNRHLVELVDGVPVTVPVDAESGYQLTAALVDGAWSEGVKAVLVASPSNPTGTLLARGEMQKLHEWCESRGAALIVDEIYQGLVYDESGGTALSVSDNLFVVNSFSKYFGMTGWRLGWLVAPDEFIDPLERLAQNVYLSAPTLSQHAALSAFTPEVKRILEQRREEFHQRRDFLLQALTELGFRIPLAPQGAFYLYVECQAISSDSYRFAYDLLEQAGVAVTPGRDFGNYRPQAHLRFAYTRPVDQLAEGVERIRRFLD
jgi:aspartate/methionine/tyrosine aminotransferase